MPATLARRLVWAFMLAVILPAGIRGAEPTFLGKLSLLADESVANKLDLDQEVRAKVEEVIEAREQAALELAIEIKELTAEERNAKLAPFVAESEQQGLALLNEEQLKMLDQVVLARKGLIALLEDEELATSMSVTPEQRESFAAKFKERDEQIEKGGEATRSTNTQYYERQVARLLTPAQKIKWESLAGVPAGETGAPARPVPAEADPMTAGQVPPRSTDPRATDPRATPQGTAGRGSTGRATGGVPPDPMVDVLPPVRTQVSPDGKLQFQFRYAPWKVVLDWFAQQADLSLEGSVIPEGTFNYVDSRRYTPAEAIDIINSVLLTKGYTMIRRGRMLMVVDLESVKSLREFVTPVSPEELDARGDFELVGCLFELDKFAPEDAEAEIRKLLGPQGSIVVTPKARHVYVVDTAGTLRMIRRIIERIENPDAGRDDTLTDVPVASGDIDNVMQTVRQLLGIAEGANQTADGALRIVPDKVNQRLLVHGKPTSARRVEEIVKMIDLPGGRNAFDTPQLEVYKVFGTDPAAVLAVMQVLLAELPDVRLATDPKTGNLVALARPSEHATIRATLDQMQKDKRVPEVFVLKRVDPQLAVLTINKIFNIGEGGDPNAPKVEADPYARQLIVFGTPDQVEQIRSLIDKMGEGDAALLAGEDRGNLRFIPMTSSNRSLLDQMEAIWPVAGMGNRIRVIKSAPDNSNGRPREMRVPRDTGSASELQEEYERWLNEREAAPQATPAAPAPAAPATPLRVPADTKSTQRTPKRVPVQFAAYQQPAEEEAPAPSGAPAGDNAPAVEKKPSKPGAEIVVTVGPGGIFIASEDREALDEFEAILQELISRNAVAGPTQDFTVIYLKFARAEVAAALLQEILGAGGGDTGGGGGGGSLLGGLASAALGGGGGDLIGGLLGGMGDSGYGSGATIATSGKVTIIPDPRLNALIVQAGPADIDLVEQLLTVIDQEYSDEAQTQPAARLIPVKYRAADEVAALVKEQFASRIAGAAGAGGQQRGGQPSPQDLIAMIAGGGRGGRGGRGGGGQAARGEEPKMTVSADKLSNSVIVSAPDPLFKEVKAFVEQVDQTGTDNEEQTVVINLKHANPNLVRNALSAHFGTSATISTTAANATTPQASLPGQTAGRTGRGGTTGGGGSDLGSQIEMIRQLNSAMQGGGGRGGFGGQGGGFGGGQTGGRGGFGGAAPGGSSRGGGSTSGRGGRGGR